MLDTTRAWLRDIREARESQVERETLERIRFAKEVVLPSLRKEIPVSSVWIFGSVARKEATEDSDIDIFVEAGPEWDNVSWGALQDAANRAKQFAMRQDRSFDMDIVVWTTRHCILAAEKEDPFWMMIQKEGVEIFP